MSETKQGRKPAPAGKAAGWSSQVPWDLRLRLLDALSYGSCGPQDIWDELVDWLEEHRVPAPERGARLASAGKAATFACPPDGV